MFYSHFSTGSILFASHVFTCSGFPLRWRQWTPTWVPPVSWKRTFACRHSPGPRATIHVDSSCVHQYNCCQAPRRPTTMERQMCSMWCPPCVWQRMSAVDLENGGDGCWCKRWCWRCGAVTVLWPNTRCAKEDWNAHCVFSYYRSSPSPYFSTPSFTDCGIYEF